MLAGIEASVESTEVSDVPSEDDAAKTTLLVFSLTISATSCAVGMVAEEVATINVLSCLTSEPSPA